MTCIVGYVEKNGDIYMGADSAATRGNEIKTRNDSKIFKTEDFIFGYCGSPRMGQLLKFKFDPPPHYAGVDDYEYMVTEFVEGVREIMKSGGFNREKDEVDSISYGEFLVGYNGKLYHIHSDYQIAIHPEDFDCCGCGADFAISALYAIENQKMSTSNKIKKALKISASCDSCVAAPFKILKLKAKNGGRKCKK